MIVPPPNVPPPNIVVVNAGARASAAASATAIAVANVRTGDTIIRQNMVVDGGGAAAAVTSSAFAVTDASVAMEAVVRERELLIQAICLDASNNPHPASQTFGGRDVDRRLSRRNLSLHVRHAHCAYRSTVARPIAPQAKRSGTKTSRVSAAPQIERRPCNERSLLRRFGPGDKMVRIRDSRNARRPHRNHLQRSDDHGWRRRPGRLADSSSATPNASAPLPRTQGHPSVRVPPPRKRGFLFVRGAPNWRLSDAAEALR